MVTKGEIVDLQQHINSSRFKTYIIAWSVFFVVAVLAGTFNGTRGSTYPQLTSVATIVQAD